MATMYVDVPDREFKTTICSIVSFIVKHAPCVAHYAVDVSMTTGIYINSDVTLNIGPQVEKGIRVGDQPPNTFSRHYMISTEGSWCKQEHVRQYIPRPQLQMWYGVMMFAHENVYEVYDYAIYIVSSIIRICNAASTIQRAWQRYCQKRLAAAIVIQTRFRECIYTPSYAMCRRRLLREWEEMAHELG
jgi:hypothetical protein